MAITPVLPLTTSKSNEPSQGQVWLVGAGPGDPDLLTVKALRCINKADVILYDRLISPEICQLFPKATPAFYVGKQKSNHSVPQHELNEILISQAKAGNKVCRLKGGDPFVFGRGGEELMALKAHNIPVEVIPGITAAAGASCYAGIPLTHRNIAQGCSLITAHGEKTLSIPWPALVELNHSLVFYMGLSKAHQIQSELIKAGMNSSTPVAIVEKGCFKDQRTVTGKVIDLEQLTKSHRIQSPALIIIGEVVKLRDQLDWYSQEFLSDQQIGQYSKEKIDQFATT